MKCSRCGRNISKDESLEYKSQALCKECLFKDEEFIALSGSAIEQTLHKLLPLSDTISLVVTGHLLIEYWLDWLIKLVIPHPEILFESARLTFLQKLNLAEALGLLSKKYADAIRILNNIRNHFSHNLEYKVSTKDLNVFRTFWPSLTKEQQSALNMLGSPKMELIAFCINFAGYANGYADSHSARLKGGRRKH
jgi:hypothetical protein